MHSALVVIFVIAYAAIALEHPIKINKSASALLGAGLLWTVYATLSGDPALVGPQLNESLASTAQIVFFLMGAMTIVEVIDAHNGFEVITSRIRTTKLSGLAWLVGFVAFFLSAVLDNLTTAIVMISLMRKLLDKQDDRLYFAALIVISANAGGAWTPIGDVTTTMLWIGGVIQALSWVVARHRDTPKLMRCYWDTIEACVPAERVLATLRHAGFASVQRPVQAGIFSEFRAVRLG